MKDYINKIKLNLKEIDNSNDPDLLHEINTRKMIRLVELFIRHLRIDHKNTINDPGVKMWIDFIEERIGVYAKNDPKYESIKSISLVLDIFNEFPPKTKWDSSMTFNGG